METADHRVFRESVEAKLLRQIDDKPVLAGVLNLLVSRLTTECSSARIFLSGGVIRDAAVSIAFGAELPLSDFDLVLEGISASQLETSLEEVSQSSEDIEWFDRVGMSFPVWKLKLKDVSQGLDIALVRTERSFGSGHRDFQIRDGGVTVEDDSLRRDFDMNSMYLELEPGESGGLHGHLLDFHDGLSSILHREIRCVGDPAERFTEDPLRLLRAIRFEAKLGFYIEERTATVMHELAPGLIKTVAKERIADEIFRSLIANPVVALSGFSKYGVLQQVFPSLFALPKEAFQRTAVQIGLLLDRLGSVLNPTPVFAAFFYEFGRAESDQRHDTSGAKDDVSYAASKVLKMAKQARLPNAKRIAVLCKGALLLGRYPDLKHADAIVEGLMRDSEVTDELFALYASTQESYGKEVIDFRSLIQGFPKPSLDFGRLFATAGIPHGSHLSEMKLALRQAEIEGRISDEQSARDLLVRAYERKAITKSEKLPRMVTTGKVILRNLVTDAEAYIQELFCSGSLERIWPELAALIGLSQHSPYHTEDAFTHTLNVVRELRENRSKELILAALFHDTGKALTQSWDTSKRMFHFYGHEKESVHLFRRACKRLGLTEDDIDIDTTVWLILNHQKARLPLSEAKNPRRTMRRFFSRGGHIAISDLFALAEADILGAVPSDNGITIAKLAELDRFRRLAGELEKESLREKEARKVGDAIKAIWNGHAVLRHFPVRGAQVGKLLKRGQNFVRSRLCLGEVVTESLVRDYVAKEGWLGDSDGISEYRE